MNCLLRNWIVMLQLLRACLEAKIPDMLVGKYQFRRITKDELMVLPSVGNTCRL